MRTGQQGNPSHLQFMQGSLSRLPRAPRAAWACKRCACALPDRYEVLALPLVHVVAEGEEGQQHDGLQKGQAGGD